MLIQEGTEDGEERCLLWELNRTEEEVALQTWVDNEGTSCRIHRSYVHRALDLLDCELLSVVPVSIILVLADESDGTLCIILIESWHVQVIDEVNQLVLANWSIDFTSATLKLLFEDGLE